MRTIEKREFEKLLNRNVLFPIFFGIISVIFFVAIIGYLLSVARWLEKSDTAISTANIIVKLMVDQEASARGFVLMRDEQYLQPYRYASERLPSSIATLRDMLRGDRTQARHLEAMVLNYQHWHDYAERAIQQRGSGVPIEEVVSPVGKKLMDQIRYEGEALLADLADERAVHARNARKLVIAMVASFVTLSALLSGVLAHLGRRQMLSLAASYEKLLRDLDLQNTALHDEEWLRISELGLAEQIIGQLPLPILCQNVLAYLAERIGLLVGALYVNNGEDVFKREANYGFSKKFAQRDQRYARGEGMVGQAAAENRVIVLKEAPPDYLKVNSGLGEATPLHVLLVPIRAETAIVAVLELGFFRAIEQRDLVFLERVAENIGAAIVAAIYRRRLNEALLEMQQLNDELQAQQEELQATNQELEEQSQVLAESQERLESQHAELEQVNEALKENNEILRSTRGLLEQRALQLEQASRYKSEFLANMSHELRTPLNSALILSKLLADNAQSNLTEDQVRFANAIHAAGQDLLALINDVLDLSKVEAGKIDITPGETPIIRVVETLRTYFEPLAAEKHLAFTQSIAPDVPASIRTDRQRLEQILRNLLSNAFKFTTQGNVHLAVEKGEHGMLAFSVSDSGIGISADRQELIFEPFHQIDSASNRKFGGAGLGLSISRDLARLLGGSISVSSAPGSGSRFTLNIPLEFREGAVLDTLLPLTLAAAGEDAIVGAAMRPACDFADDRDALSSGGKRILVVEDEVQFARILYDLSHELGYSCLVATSAEEAFELATAYTPNAILLDMKLPDHSGLSVLARLKEEPKTRHIPVHILSVEERSSVALRMGAVSYALKPITHEKLRELFANVEKNLTSKLKSVLIVENFAAQEQNSARLIESTNVTTTTVALGEQALRLLKERVFDCMIVDYELADMSASELLERMTKAEICSFPPVIVNATRNLSREEEEKLLRHSHSIIIKGVRSPEQLLDEVTLFIHHVEADLPDDRQVSLRRDRTRNRAFEGRKILIVDDDVRNIFALTSVLEARGAQIEVGRNGFEAIRKLSESDDIDLVLMDIMMPEMDGYEAIEKIRQDRRFAKLPIIAVTAKAMREDQERCLKVGASDYVAKPINLDRLISLIRAWLPQVQRL